MKFCDQPLVKAHQRRKLETSSDALPQSALDVLIMISRCAMDRSLEASQPPPDGGAENPEGATLAALLFIRDAAADAADELADMMRRGQAQGN